MYLIRCVLILVICIVPLASCKVGNDNINKVVIETSVGSNHIFQVQIANTPEKWERGLMFVEYLPKDHGMLFYYDENKPQSFWMKNTLISLDVIFIKENGKISNIHHMAVPLDEETKLPSLGSIVAALEVNGGTAAKLGIKAGDVVKHPFFKK